MLCIKKMNPLKKCNREEAAVQGLALGFRWNGEAPFWAEPVTAAWPASGTCLSTSPYALSQPVSGTSCSGYTFWGCVHILQI